MTTRWLKYHKGAVAKLVTLPDVTLSKTTFSDNAVVGSTLCTIIGADPRATITTSDPRFKISNNNTRLIRAAGAWVDGPSTVTLIQTLDKGCTNSPHPTTINFTVAPPAGGVVLVPGITPYRSWPMDDETTLAQQGNPGDYGYNSKAVGIWINGMYDTFTDTFNFGVAAWKGGPLANFKAGDTRGIWKVEFSANNGPKTTITAVTTDTATGRAGYWAQLKASDFDHSQTIEIRAYIWPLVGKPMILQGRAAAGPPGQNPTYDTDAGPIVPLFTGYDGIGTANSGRGNAVYTNTAVAIDPRLWTTGPVNGGILSQIAGMRTGWSLVCNVDIGDGLMPGMDMFIHPDTGNDNNDGLTAATPVQTFDAIVSKAPAAMAAAFGTIHDGSGNAWADIGGLRINLLASANHSTGLVNYHSMLGAANQWVTIRVAPGVARSAVKITRQAARQFIAEKVRLLGLDFYGTGYYHSDNGTPWLDRYGDLRAEDCTFDMGPNLYSRSGPLDDRTFNWGVNLISGGTGYTSGTTITCAQGTGITFTPVISAGVITGVKLGPTDEYGNFLAHPVGYMDSYPLTITDTAGTGANITLDMGGSNQYMSVATWDGGSNYTAPTVTVSGPGSGWTFTPQVVNGNINYITTNYNNKTAAQAGYTEGSSLIITDSTGSGARATLVKGIGWTGNIINGGSGYTTPPTVTNSSGTGSIFTATILNGKVTSILCSNTSSTTAYTEGSSFVFSGGGGSGAVATMHVLYGGAPGGGPDGTGNAAAFTMNNAMRGHFEILDPPGKSVPTFTRQASLGTAQTLTLVRNVWIDQTSSAGDLIGGAKGVLGCKVTHTREYQVPGSGGGEGNHFDFLQPYNHLYNIVYEDVNNTLDCNMQGFFADGNAPITNGALIRANLQPGIPLPAQQIAFGGGADNMLVLDCICGWVGTMKPQFYINDLRVLVTDAGAAAGAGWGGAGYQSPEYTPHKGMSVVYSSSPAEPYDQGPVSTVFDTLVAPSKLLEVLDAKLGGSLAVIKSGSSTRTDPRVYYWRDPRDAPRDQVLITAMTNANPAVFTAPAHGFTQNRYITIPSDIYTAMYTNTNVRMSSNGQWFVQVIDADHFSLMDPYGVPYDGTSAGTYDPTVMQGAAVEANNQYLLVDGGTTLYERDQRRPQYLATGINGQPCVAFNVGLSGLNDTTTYPPPNNGGSGSTYFGGGPDQALGGGIGPYGAYAHEIWYCGALDHAVSDTTDRYLFSWGNFASTIGILRSNVSGNQVLRATVPNSNGSTNANAVMSTDVATLGNLTAGTLLWFRLQALANSAVFTVGTAAHPTGVSYTSTFAGGYTKSVQTGRSGIGGRCSGQSTGDPGSFTSQRISARVLCQPLATGEANAMISEFRTRLGF